MKKLLILSMALCATFALWAENSVITYTASEKLPEVSGVNQQGLHTNSFDVNILSHLFLDGQGVITFDGELTKIGAYAFYGCKKLCTITIPEGVAELSQNAFATCSYLSSIELPQSLEIIGNSAFSRCSKLSGINIPDNVVSIGRMVFTECESLEKEGGLRYAGIYLVGIPDKKALLDTIYTVRPGTKWIGNSAFSQTHNIKEVVLPNSVVSIDDDAFSYCTNLQRIELPKNLQRIGANAFGNCSTLVAIQIPKNVNQIGERAFSNCNNLKSANIPEGVTVIEDGTFFQDSISEIVIPESVTSIGSTAFSGCPITNVVIPNNVKTIGNGAFSGCEQLETVTIGMSVTSINYYSFYNCPRLTSIQCLAITPPDASWPEDIVKLVHVYVPANCYWDYLRDYYWGKLYYLNTISNINTCGDNALWKFDNDTLTVFGYGEMYDMLESTCSWSSYSENITHVNIDKNITKVGAYSFYNHTNLRSFSLGPDVKEIGKYAFGSCPSLTYTGFNEDLSIIGSYAFLGCTNLNKLVFLDSLKYIHDHAFESCVNVTSIVFGSGLQSIGTKAFYKDIRVNDMTCRSARTPDVGTDALSSISDLAYLYVPNAYIRTYKLDLNWSRFDIQGFDPIAEPERDSVIVNVTSTSAEFLWSKVDGAESYTLIIWADGIKSERVCTLLFDAEGRLVKVDFSRKGSYLNAEEDGFQFEVTGLEQNTQYPFTLMALDNVEQVIYQKELIFYTSSATGDTEKIERTPDTHNRGIFMRDGRMYIFRDGRVYTLTGNEMM